MEEVESFSLFFSFDHFFCKNVILFQDLRNILLTDGILFCICCYNRLHRDQHIKNIRAKLRAAGVPEPEKLLNTVWGVGYRWKSED